MATSESGGVLIPEAFADDFLDQVERAAKIARNFKRLVMDLATQDYRDVIEPEHIHGSGDEPSDGLDQYGRFRDPLHLWHGDYAIEPSRIPEVDRVTYVEAAVLLTKPNGGRAYQIFIDSVLNRASKFVYYEDLLPLTASPGLNLLDKFLIEGERLGDPGINIFYLDVIEMLTKGIRAVSETKRFHETDCQTD